MFIQNRDYKHMFGKWLLPAWSIALKNHILLRNHLRSNEKDRDRYGIQKKALSERYRNDIDDYVEGKTEFIIQILAIYGLGGFDEIRTANKR